MLTTTPVHPEGSRYAAPIVYLPGLWVGARLWARVAGHLAHRGWDGAIVDARTVGGGLAGRAAALAEHRAVRGSPPVVLGHDAGALVALALAARVPVRAIVLVCPLAPGAPATHALVWSAGLVWSLLRRRPVLPPAGAVGDAFVAALPPAVRETLGPDDPRLLAELARRIRVPRPVAPTPVLVVSGATDRLAPPADVAALARELAADTIAMPDAGHWLVADGASQACADRVHRWLVQRLGEPLLELYADAMAERDDGDDDATP